MDLHSKPDVCLVTIFLTLPLITIIIIGYIRFSNIYIPTYTIL